MIAAEPAIVSNLHQGTGIGGRVQESCFEVFGLDILVDANLRPWLLEVNVSPSLSSSSPFDRRIKTMLMADVLTLVGMEPFDPREVEQQQSAERAARLLGKGEPLRSRNVTRLQDTAVEDFGEAEWRLIMSTYDEFMRKGNLEILFPLPRNVQEYAKYFGTVRYNNVVLAKWLERDGERVMRHVKDEGV